MGERWIRRHLPSWLVRFGWLTGVWHMRALFGGSLQALLKKVLSAGECGVKPRGFGRGIFLSPPCLFHQHMCSVKPWPLQCHIEYLPPSAWCGLTPVWRCWYWSCAAEVIPPGTRPHHNTHITNVGVCESTLPAVCLLLATTAHTLPYPRVIPWFVFACWHVHVQCRNPCVCDFCDFSIQHYQMSPYTCTASSTVSLINGSPPPSSPHCSLLTYLLRLGVWRHACIFWASDWFVIVYISGRTPPQQMFAGVHVCGHAQACRSVLMPKKFHPGIFRSSWLWVLALRVLIASKWGRFLPLNLFFLLVCVFGHMGKIIQGLCHECVLILVE